MAQQKRSPILVAILYDLALCCLIFAGIVFLLHYLEEAQPGLLLSGWIVGGAGVVLFLTALAASAFLLLLKLQAVETHTAAGNALLRRTLSGLAANEAALTQVCENLLLSDNIKSVLFREKDRRMVLDAIRQDMRKEKWDSALQLITAFDEQFGARVQAAELREELTRLKSATRQEKIDAAITHVESLWRIHDYGEALHEVAGLLEVYAEDARVQQLRRETEEHREIHKQALLARLDHAVRDDDMDQAVEVIRLLDVFLSRDEAAALAEDAAGVFKAKLQKMGVQFSLFVKEKDWAQALKVGREIVAEFPTSQIAEQVKGRLPVLEQRAKM